MLATITLATLVAFAPANLSDDPASKLRQAVDGSTRDDRAAAIADLEAAIALALYSPEAASGSLDPVLLEAHVALVRLYVSEGDEQRATEGMDALIRLARGQIPPVRDYGRTVSELYEARKAELQAAGVATIDVSCDTACDVVIQARRLPATSETLFLGTYDVWVKASEGDAEWEFHEVILDTPDVTQSIDYVDPNPKPDTYHAPVLPPPPPKPKSKRLLPRGAEIAGVAVGVGMLVAGVVLATFDGKCSNTKQPPTADSTAETCGNIYDTGTPGYALLGVGGGLLVISGVLVAIDEVRVGRAKGRQVMVGATLKF